MLSTIPNYLLEMGPNKFLGAEREAYWIIEKRS